MHIPSAKRLTQMKLVIVLLVSMVLTGFAGTSTATAQEPPEPGVNAADIQAVMNAQSSEDAPPPAEPSGIDMLSLIASGGGFMIPIGLMSLLVVTLAAERLLSLRSGKIVPRRLKRELRDNAEPVESLDPPSVYQACLDNPSPTASVLGAMMLRTGQPLGEIERTATETIQREADRYAAPIRWLNLAAAATPLMGLLGTVWGMIVAFHDSTSLSADRSRSEQLSEGIYTALVTTLAGLAVAIPAAILAQYLENRVATLFHRIEQIAFDIAPGLARFAGRRRMDADGRMLPMDLVDGNTGKVPPPPPPPNKPPPNKPANNSGKKSGKNAPAKAN